MALGIHWNVLEWPLEWVGMGWNGLEWPLESGGMNLESVWMEFHLDFIGIRQNGRFQPFRWWNSISNIPVDSRWNSMEFQHSVATAPAQSQLKPEAEPSLAEAQPELLSGGSHIPANSSSS